MRNITIYATVLATLVAPGLAFAQDYLNQDMGNQRWIRPFNLQTQKQRFDDRQKIQDEQVRQFGNILTGNPTVCADGWGNRVPAGSGYCPWGTRPSH